MQVRQAGRTGMALTPFGALCGAVAPAGAPSPFGELTPNWLDLPVELPAEEWHQAAARVAPASRTLVRFGPTCWETGMRPACRDLLSRIGASRVDVAVLGTFDLERIKAGGPFKAMDALREEGLVRFFGICVANPDEALWCLDHTPVHVLLLGQPTATPSDWKDLAAACNDAEVGLLASAATVGHDLDLARGVLGETSLTGFAWPLPGGAVWHPRLAGGARASRPEPSAVMQE